MPVIPSSPALRQMIKAVMKDRAPEMYARLRRARLLEQEVDNRVAIAREAQVAAITQATIASWEQAMALALEFESSGEAPQTTKSQPASASIDPELLAFGAELTAFHIEAGARRFVDLARAITADLETTLDKIKPYLRAWYNGARDMMEDAGISVEGMDGPDAVKAALAQIGIFEAGAKNADVSGMEKQEALKLAMWAKAESAKLEPTEPKGSQMEKEVLATWRQDRPKMVALLAEGGVAALAHVLVNRAVTSEIQYLKAGMGPTDAQEQAAREWLLLEPEDDRSTPAFDQTITSPTPSGW